MVSSDRTTPTFHPNGIRPVGGNSTPVAPATCACGITAIVSTIAWGLQCQPCYDADVRKAAGDG